MVTFSGCGQGAGGAGSGGVWSSLLSLDVILDISHVAGGGFGRLGRNLGFVREGGVRGDHGIISRPDRSSGKDISRLGSPGPRGSLGRGSTHFVPVYVMENRCTGEDSLWSSNRHGDLEVSDSAWLQSYRPPGSEWEAFWLFRISMGDLPGRLADVSVCVLPWENLGGAHGVARVLKGPLLVQRGVRGGSELAPQAYPGGGRSPRLGQADAWPGHSVKFWRLDPSVAWLQPARDPSRVLLEARFNFWRLDPSEAWLQPAREPSRVLKEACVVVWGGLGLNPIPPTPGLARGDDCYGWVHTAFGGPGQALFFLLFLFPLKGNPAELQVGPQVGGERQKSYPEELGGARCPSKGGARLCWSWDEPQKDWEPSSRKALTRVSARYSPKTTFEAITEVERENPSRRVPQVDRRGGTGPIPGRYGGRRLIRSVTFSRGAPRHRSKQVMWWTRSRVILRLLLKYGGQCMVGASTKVSVNGPGDSRLAQRGDRCKKRASSLDFFVSNGAWPGTLLVAATVIGSEGRKTTFVSLLVNLGSKTRFPNEFSHKKKRGLLLDSLPCLLGTNTVGGAPALDVRPRGAGRTLNTQGGRINFHLKNCICFQRYYGKWAGATAAARILIDNKGKDNIRTGIRGSTSSGIFGIVHKNKGVGKPQNHPRGEWHLIERGRNFGWTPLKTGGGGVGFSSAGRTV